MRAIQIIGILKDSLLILGILQKFNFWLWDSSRSVPVLAHLITRAGGDFENSFRGFSRFLAILRIFQAPSLETRQSDTFPFFWLCNYLGEFLEYSNLVSRFIRDSKRFYARILAIVEHGEEGGDEASADELKTALNIPFIFGISLWFTKWPRLYKESNGNITRNKSFKKTQGSEKKNHLKKKTNKNTWFLWWVRYSLS